MEQLLRILPIIHGKEAFAIKGGPAINFFFRQMPRLSVDIDLVYLPVNNREEALLEISGSSKRIADKISKLLPATKSIPKLSREEYTGLVINKEGASVKIEANTTIRGSVFKPEDQNLCDIAVGKFNLTVRAKSMVFKEL